jgi:hypothetical protein
MADAEIAGNPGAVDDQRHGDLVDLLAAGRPFKYFPLLWQHTFPVLRLDLRAYSSAVGVARSFDRGQVPLASADIVVPQNKFPLTPQQEAGEGLLSIVAARSGCGKDFRWRGPSPQ